MHAAVGTHGCEDVIRHAWWCAACASCRRRASPTSRTSRTSTSRASSTTSTSGAQQNCSASFTHPADAVGRGAHARVVAAAAPLSRPGVGCQCWVRTCARACLAFLQVRQGRHLHVCRARAHRHQPVQEPAALHVRGGQRLQGWVRTVCQGREAGGWALPTARVGRGWGRGGQGPRGGRRGEQGRARGEQGRAVPIPGQ